MMVCLKLVVGWGLWRFNFHFEDLSHFFLNKRWSFEDLPERIPFRIGDIFSDHLFEWILEKYSTIVEGRVKLWIVTTIKNPSTLHGGVKDLMIFNTKAEAEDPI